MGKQYWHLRKLDLLFEFLGRTVVREPCKVMAFSVALSILLASGVVNLNMVSSSNELWIPRDSAEYKNIHRTDELFPSGGRGTLMFVLGAEKESNVLDEQHLVATFVFHQELLNVEAGGKKYDSFCERSYSGGPCKDWSIFQLWGNDKQSLEDAFKNKQIQPAIAALKSKISLETMLGGVLTDSEGSVSAKAMILKYTVDSSPEAIVWEKLVRSKILATKQVIRTEMLANSAIEEEVSRLVSGDSTLFGGAIMLILIYLSLTLGKLDVVESRFLLAWSGIATIMLSVLAAFGTTSMLGIDMNSIVALLAFILAGVGVDDMIVIVHHFDQFSHVTNMEERMTMTMKEGGSAVTLTSMTAIFAFIGGLVLPLPGVVSFCANAMVAFAWTFFLSITFFPAMLVLDQRRIDKQHHFLFFWKKVEAKTYPEKGGVMPKKESMVRMTPGSSPKLQVVTTPAAAPRNYYYEDKLCDVILSKLGKFCTLFITLGAIVAVTLVVGGIKVGLTIRDVIPDDSFVHRALDVYAEQWPASTGGWSIIAQDMDYSKDSDREAMITFLNWFESQDYALPPFGGISGTWLSSYLLYLQATNASTAQFYDHMEPFLDAYPAYRRDVSCPTLSCKEIKASRFHITVLDPSDSKERYKLNQAVKDHITDLPLIAGKVYMVGSTLGLSTTDNIIPSLTIETMLSSVATIALTLMLFTHVSIAVIIAIMVASIDVLLLSSLVWWNIKLNVVSYVNLVMSVGLSVDYCVHIGHAFAHATGKGDERVRHALHTMASSVFKGGLTTFIGVMMLSIASSDAFRTFFKMLFCTVVLGVYHGLVVLPVLLSLIGDYVVPVHVEAGIKTNVAYD